MGKEKKPFFLTIQQSKKRLGLISLILYFIYVIVYLEFRVYVTQMAVFGLIPIIFMSVIDQKWGMGLALINFPIHILMRMHFNDSLLFALNMLIAPFITNLLLSYVIGGFVELNLVNYRNCKKLQKKIKENEELKSLVPICSKCKKIRDDEGYWSHIEHYLQDHQKMTFSHGICPDCREKIENDIPEDNPIDDKELKNSEE